MAAAGAATLRLGGRGCFGRWGRWGRGGPPRAGTLGGAAAGCTRGLCLRGEDAGGAPPGKGSRRLSCLRAGGARMSAAAGTNGGQDIVAVFVTVPDKEAAEKVARALLEPKLAACVNILPGVESWYWWEGSLQQDQELLLMIKSRRSLLDSITAAVVQAHPYDVPEVISTSVDGGNPAYLDWVRANAQGPPLG